MLKMSVDRALAQEAGVPADPFGSLSTDMDGGTEKQHLDPRISGPNHPKIL